MAKRSKGFKRMIWICPNCQARNPGPEPTCLSCGAPQPPEAEFILPAQANFIQAESEIARARQGPDLICPYCGSRNPAGNITCRQCAAPLDEAARRRAGQIARQEIPASAQTCPACGAGNPLTATNCAQCGAPLGSTAMPSPQPAAARALAPKKKNKMARLFGLGGLLFFLLLCCGLLYALFARPARTLTAQVSQVYWRTTVSVQEVQAVDYVNEPGDPPGDAYNVSCRVETTQICEETTVDRGNGYAEVIEECRDESETYCSYTVDEWTTIDTYTIDGYDLSPYYAQPTLAPGQRLGEQNLYLLVTFSAEGENWDYTPNSLDEFQRYIPGTQWALTLNALGGVIEVSAP